MVVPFTRRRTMIGRSHLLSAVGVGSILTLQPMIAEARQMNGSPPTGQTALGDPEEAGRGRSGRSKRRRMSTWGSRPRIVIIPPTKGWGAEGSEVEPRITRVDDGVPILDPSNPFVSGSPPLPQKSPANEEEAPTAGPLDTDDGDITVTGRVSNALRRSSSPMSIVTSGDIRQKQVSNMTDLLRGEIPGLLVFNAGSNDWTTKVYSRGTTSWNYERLPSDLNNDYARILIDGVELSRPTLLSMIDPRSIERIEMVRGAQAGIVYGTDGASGLLEITTRKGPNGGTRPELVAQASAGFMESRNTPDGATPWIQDHSLQMTGGGAEFGYRLGGTYQTVGEWAPGFGSKAYGVSGGLRIQRGSLGITLSGLRQHRDLAPFAGMTYPMSQTLLAATITHRTSQNWRNSLTLGRDSNSFGYSGAAAGRAPTYYDADYERRSIRYLSSYELPLAKDVSATLTTGGDAVLYRGRSIRASGFAGSGGRIDPTTAATIEHDRQSWNNFGYYGLLELDFSDTIFLTIAARVEEDLRNVVRSKRRQVQPRLGLSYVVDSGPLTLKVRGQWGRSARAPISDVLAGGRSGPYAFRPSPIGPEVKEGWDAGLDATWGGIGSFSVTRFEEAGRDLIMPFEVDAGTRPILREWRNFGVITNKGWELESDATLGRVSLRGNLILTDNRIRRMSPIQNSGQFAAGRRVLNVPRYSGGLTAILNLRDGSFSANTSFLGPRELRFTGTAPPLWRVNVRAERSLTRSIVVFGRIDNLTRNQSSDELDPAFAFAPGRSTVLGIRKSF